MVVDKFLIEASHTMMFARSIGDCNQIYYDSDYAKNTEVGAIIAPPTFLQARTPFDLSYRLRPKAGDVGRFESEGLPLNSIPDQPIEQKDSSEGDPNLKVVGVAAACMPNSVTFITGIPKLAMYWFRPQNLAGHRRNRITVPTN